MEPTVINRVFTISKSARVSFNRPPSVSIKKVWFILHGYGHLSPYFIRKFKCLSEDESVLLICPEGLHRYYLDGVSGKVGASWMTKEERELDIEDNLNYLGQLYEQVLIELKANGAIPEQINVLGFSQGGATACRWAWSGKQPIDRLILYASVFPPDVVLETASEKIKQLKTIIAVGTEDEYLSQDEVKLQHEKFKPMVNDLELLIFEGKHQIYDEVLKRLK